MRRDGAAGFIGSHLCERLLALGHEVVGLDAFVPYYPRAVKERNLAGLRGRPGFRFDVIDLRSDPLEAVVADAEAVFHLAAMPGLVKSWTDFDAYNSCNVTATQRLLDALRIAPRLRRLIHVSTSSVYGRFAAGDENLPTKPVSPYGVTKLAAEHLCFAYADAFGCPSSCCGSSRSTARDSGPTWATTVSWMPSSTTGRSRCTATAGRSAATPTSPTPSRPPSPRWSAAGRGIQRRRRRNGLRPGRARPAGSGDGRRPCLALRTGPARGPAAHRGRHRQAAPARLGAGHPPRRRTGPSVGLARRRSAPRPCARSNRFGRIGCCASRVKDVRSRGDDPTSAPSFPNSVWETHSAKLRFASGR